VAKLEAEKTKKVSTIDTDALLGGLTGDAAPKVEAVTAPKAAAKAKAA
jgi:hypothetical protein